MSKTQNKLSYPDSKKLLNEVLNKTEAIRSLVENGLIESEKKAIEVVNDLLIERAKQTGLSLYDICFHTIPVFTPLTLTKVSTDYSEFMRVQDTFEIEQGVRLEPVEFDLTHDGGYWKNKYFALKKEMRKLIDSKEDRL